MTHIGLKGAWGLDQLCNSSVQTWKIGVLLIGGTASIGAVLLWACMSLDSSINLNTNADLVFIFAVIIGLSFYLSIFFVRTTERDLGVLQSLDESIATHFSQLQLGKVAFLRCILAGIPITMLVVLAPFALFDEDFSYFPVMHENSATKIFFYFLTPIYGVSVAVSLVCVTKQCQCLMKVARDIDIDLYRLTTYAAVANPIARYLAAYFLSLSFVVLLFTWDTNDQNDQGQFWTLIVVSSVWFTVIASYGLPVYALRNRIKKKKEDILAELENLLSEAERAKSSFPADAIAHYQFIESRWDWPIASHVQKLVLFGLLPPVTWILAALVENALF